MTEKKWYVYLLCDPDTEQPFYVGKGMGDRMYIHEKSVDTYADGNATKKQVIKQILAQGKEVLKKKVAEFDNESDALIYELAMISLYGSHITNITYGGGHSRKSRNSPFKPQRVVDAELWDAEDVMKYIGCSRSALWRYMRWSGLPHIKSGKELRFRPAALRQWIADQEIIEPVHSLN